MFASQDFSHYTVSIKPQSRGIPGQVLVFEHFLLLEKQVVHFPKSALHTGRFGGSYLFAEPHEVRREKRGGYFGHEGLSSFKLEMDGLS